MNILDKIFLSKSVSVCLFVLVTFIVVGCGEDGGLGDFGGVEFFFGAVKAEVGEIVAYNVVGLLIEVGNLRVFVGEGFAHADLLGALAGEHE